MVSSIIFLGLKEFMNNGITIHSIKIMTSGFGVGLSLDGVDYKVLQLN